MPCHTERLAEIARQQAALTAEAEQLQAQQTVPWPRRHKVYLHSNKERMWDHGEEIGLDAEGCKTFTHALYEVEFDLEVSRDGTCKIIAVDKKPLLGQY